MIGKVTLDGDDGPIVLILGDDLRWSCAEVPELAGAMDVLYPLESYSPTDGQPGYAVLNETADRMGGRVEFESRKPDPPGLAY